VTRSVGGASTGWVVVTAANRLEGSLAIQVCFKSSAAEGRAKWSRLKLCCMKSSASEEMSDGITGFALDPIYS
jgi:hypothetical protein